MLMWIGLIAGSIIIYLNWHTGIVQRTFSMDKAAKVFLSQLSVIVAAVSKATRGCRLLIGGLVTSLLQGDDEVQCRLHATMGQRLN